MRRLLIITSLVLIPFAVTACGPSSSSASSSTSGGSTLACGHWANIRSDVRAEILTDSELRAKVAEVRSSATSDAVESAATELLAGITSGDKNDMASGYLALNAACE
jgi:hypothetical protein